MGNAQRSASQTRVHARGVGAGMLCAACGAVAALSASSAHASLGHAPESVEADRAHLAARLQSTFTSAYTIHTLTTADGGVVREFVGADGVVFAVAWRGPGRPDLRQLLAEQFQVVQADNVRLKGPRTHAPLAVNRAAFVMRSGGHPGAFWGHAFLTQKVPVGFPASALQ